MRTRFFRTFLPWMLLASVSALACNVSSLTSLVGIGSKPQVTIQSPVAGTQFSEGDNVSIQSVSTDPGGIVRVELLVDGTVVRTDAPPIAQGQTSFTVIQPWKATLGTHTLSVRAYNASGGASDPALVTITVNPSTAALPTPTTQAVLPLGAPTLSLTPTLGPFDATPAATETRQTPRATATPKINAPPGVWATSIRLDPPAPKRGQFVTFYVTFFNNTGAPASYQWRIRLFYADTPTRGFGDTMPLSSTFPAGVTEMASANNWRVFGPGNCLSLIARVFWLDANKNTVEFLKPDQSGGPAAQFQVCP